jgi:hypothetical protein
MMDVIHPKAKINIIANEKSLCASVNYTFRNNLEHEIICISINDD